MFAGANTAGTKVTLLTSLYDFLDAEAVSVVYKPNILGLKKCENMFALSLYVGVAVEDLGDWK